MPYPPAFLFAHQQMLVLIAGAVCLFGTWGIETDAQWQFLACEGCAKGQGLSVRKARGARAITDRYRGRRALRAP
jgi:EAL domain-containing protein (putative c-di-GMP-specific phosphodiesterase class I)